MITRASNVETERDWPQDQSSAMSPGGGTGCSSCQCFVIGLVVARAVDPIGTVCFSPLPLARLFFSLSNLFLKNSIPFDP